MFGHMPGAKQKNIYCTTCGEKKTDTSPDWKFGVKLKGYSHVHADGSAHQGEWMTDLEHAERFPGPKILQKDGGSCIVFDV